MWGKRTSSPPAITRQQMAVHRHAMIDVFAPVLPLQMVAATTRLDRHTTGWELLNPGVDRARFVRVRITFEHTFYNPPLVHVGLAGFDIENGDAARLGVQASDVDATGFTVEIKSWFNTRIWSVDVSWLAIGH
jgi:hypothetical protein